MTTTGTPTPQWQGMNHLALVTTDMDATVRFYHGVLGARLVSTVATDAFRHYFVELGPLRAVA
ncbi:MAG: VOC family protein [Nocardioidaceae bacterium]